MNSGPDGPIGLDRYDAGVLLGSGFYLLLNLFTSGGTPMLLGGDELGFWTNAQRLLHGELIYRDFFEFTPPGTDLIYLVAFRLLGSHVWVTNVVVLLLGAVLSWSCFRLSRLIMEPLLAALVAAVFLILDYGKWLDGTHHWFSALAVISGLIVLLPRASAVRIAICGALLGAASFFTQTRGMFAALGVAAYLLWHHFSAQEPWRVWARRLGLLSISFVVTLTALSGYFAAKVGWERLWYFQVSFARHYMTTQWNGLPEHVSQWPLRYLALYWLIPIVYALTLGRLWKLARGLPPQQSARVALIACVGGALYLEVALSPNILRVYCIAMPAIVLGVWLVVAQAGRVRTSLIGLLSSVCIALAAHQTLSRQLDHSIVRDLPGGRIALLPLSAEKLDWIAMHTQPGDYFFQSRLPGVYLPLALRVPTYTFLFHETRPEFLSLSMQQLEQKRVRYILWSPGLDTPPNLFAAFHRFLLDRYQRVWTFSDREEIWQLK